MNGTIMRKSGVLYVGLVLGSTSALGQNPTVFVAPAGTIIPSPPVTITANGGDVLTLEVWVQDIPDGTGNRLKEFQATMPCTASGGTSGSIDYPAELIPTVNDGYDTTTADPDYVFFGLTRAGWGWSSGKCDLNQLDNFPSSFRGVFVADAVAPPAAKYMATFTYNVSPDARGTFTIQPAAPVDPSCPPRYGSYLKGMKGIAPATCYTPTYTALTIEIGVETALGACCDLDPFGECQDGVLRSECACDKCEWLIDTVCADLECPHEAIPTVSEWGLAILTLLLLTGAKIYFGRRGFTSPW